MNQIFNRTLNCGIIFLLLMLSSCFKEEQSEELKNSFVRAFGGLQASEGRDVKQLADGNYLVLGHTSNLDSFGYNVFLVKVDVYGNTIWENSIGESVDEKAFSMDVLPNNDIIIAGTIAVAGGTNILLIRTDSDGDILWKRKIGGNESMTANHILVKEDGGYLISGSISNALTTNFLLLSSDSNGNNVKLHSKAVDGNQQAAFSAQVDSGFVFIGSNSGGADVKGASDVFMASVNNNLKSHSYKTFGSQGADFGKAVKVIPDGSLICLATYSSQSDSGSNFRLIKKSLIDAEYKTVWEHSYGTPANNDATGLEATEHGFAIIGNITNSDGSSDILFVETNLEGKEIRRRTFGGLGNQRAYSISKTFDGGYILTGINENSGNSVLLLIKFQ